MKEKLTLEELKELGATPIKPKKDPSLVVLEKINSELVKIGEKKVDLLELEKAVDLLLDAVSADSSIDTRPELELIKGVLEKINKNITSITIPELDYTKLAKTIKENVKINVSAGGGGPGAVYLKTTSNALINPATSDNQTNGEQIAKVRLDDTVQLDAFGRLRTSTAKTLFDSQQEYGLNTRFWDITANSTLPASTSSNGSVANGSVAFSSYVSAGTSVASQSTFSGADIRNPLVLSQIDALTATQTPVTIVCTSFSGTSNISAAMNWHEQII